MQAPIKEEAKRGEETIIRHGETKKRRKFHEFKTTMREKEKEYSRREERIT
jgi:hypothetical protein